MKGCIGPGEESLHLVEAKKAYKSLRGEKNKVSQVHCKYGHRLIRPGHPIFDGEPGIKLLAQVEGLRQIIYLSPFQHDTRKQVEFDFPDGALVTLECPECEVPFPIVAPHDCQTGAMYVGLFLENGGDIENSICVCNAWGCYANFSKQYDEVISELRQYLPSPLLGY